MNAATTSSAKIAIQSQQGWRSLIKPYLFSTIGIATSVTIGDVVCQYVEKKKKRTDGSTTRTPLSSSWPWWDSERSLIMCTSAILVTTPWSFTFARTVERVFPGKQGIQIAKKILTNSLLSPIYIIIFFTSVTLLKGQSLHEAKRKIKTDLPKTFVTGTCYWPFISFINFRFIPLDYRPFFASLAGALWNIYMSSVANNTVKTSNDITVLKKKNRNFNR